MVQSKREKYVFLAFCLVPAFTFFLIITIYPLVDGLRMSFYKWSGISGNKEFVGLDNYARLLSDPIILKSILNDYKLVVIKLVGIMSLATFFAVVLTQSKLREAPFFRFVFLFPNIMPVATMGILWIFIFSSSLGLVNASLEAIGLEELARPWLGTTQTALYSLSAPLIWAGIGLFMLLLMAGIMSIPRSIYEAAELDGTSEWQKFRFITLPMVWPQIKTSIIYIVITTLNGSFVLVTLMTRGGPNNATQVMGSYLYQQAFVRFNFGYGAAIGVMILVLTMLSVLGAQKLLKRDDPW